PGADQERVGDRRERGRRRLDLQHHAGLVLRRLHERYHQPDEQPHGRARHEEHAVTPDQPDVVAEVDVAIADEGRVRGADRNARHQNTRRATETTSFGSSVTSGFLPFCTSLMSTSMIETLPVCGAMRRTFAPLLPKRVRPPASETAPVTVRSASIA